MVASALLCATVFAAAAALEPGAPPLRVDKSGGVQGDAHEDDDTALLQVRRSVVARAVAAAPANAVGAPGSTASKAAAPAIPAKPLMPPPLFAQGATAAAAKRVAAIAAAANAVGANIASPSHARRSGRGETRDFLTSELDFNKLGVHKLAETKSGSFELQGFGCQSENITEQVFAGFALKVDGKVATMIKTQLSNPKSIPLEGSLTGSGVSFTSQDGSVELWVKTQATHRKLGYHQEFELKVTDPSTGGPCGGMEKREPLSNEQVLFTPLELQSMREACNPDR